MVEERQERRCTWDDDAAEAFSSWAGAGPPEGHLDAASELVAILETGYLELGPIESSQSERVARSDGWPVDVYGHTLAGSIRLFVGVCEELNEVRVVMLGPCDKRKAWKLAKSRIARW